MARGVAKRIVAAGILGLSLFVGIGGILPVRTGHAAPPAHFWMRDENVADFAIRCAWNDGWPDIRGVDARDGRIFFFVDCIPNNRSGEHGHG